jgi:alpha-amylase/alpha-mannosidase (GH57 family)
LKIKNAYKYLYIPIEQENSEKSTMTPSEVINRGREDFIIDKGKANISKADNKRHQSKYHSI